MNRKELALLLVSTALTLALAVGLIRWLAPSLLGGPRDLELVRSSEEVPPFFEGVFRPEHFKTVEMLLKDPRTVNRPRPFFSEMPALALGPHDVLGFRNRAVPAVADVVTLGDSQTYGINALLEDNWPSRMAARLPGAAVYSMAIGGWGAVQYGDMFTNAAALRPRVVIVAFYTGNDPLDSFSVAYGSDQWRALRAEPDRHIAGPEFVFPAPESDWWRAPIGGSEMVFTPKLRLFNNNEHPAVDAGYAVMAKAAAWMSSVAAQAGFRAVMTVVPTKETAYAQRVAAEKLDPPAEYRALVDAEARRTAALRAQIEALPATQYVDIVGPLQAAALKDPEIYPRSDNGHPFASGYRVIAETLAAAVAPLIPRVPEGLVSVSQGDQGRELAVLLVRDGAAGMFASGEILSANGWNGIEPQPVQSRDLAGLPKYEIRSVDRRRYGPRR